jgi:hypothetical protein
VEQGCKMVAIIYLIDFQASCPGCGEADHTPATRGLSLAPLGNKQSAKGKLVQG